ncbi:DUF2059 domain-containing protein [Arenimonas caeni]|uniref:DUF2059 domain-containing protein n=1 Tax=Arenimonas caeni TaxID=2058085 RepID=A0A2P6MCM2_9GAMM|nr:DUF2059 domain-containing protein [Arenimonas caeni]PRH83726.1 hypothetical protein C6N40_00865 [Arenimonas caeni]
MRSLRHLVFATALALPLAASAQPAAPDDAEVRQQAERLLNALDMDTQFTAMLAMTLDMQLEQKPELNKYRHVMEAFFAKHMSYAALKESLVAIYAEEFTVAELRKASEFYETEEGRNILAKMPRLMQLGGELGQRRVEENLDELVAAMQAEDARLEAEAAATQGPAAGE